MNAVIYARFSSSAQREASIEQQINACMSYAESTGYSIVQTYSDRALTGRTDRRPQFLQMIKDARKGHFCAVIVYALDRFSRDKYDSARYKHELRACGVRVVSATEPITDNPSGVLIESVFEGLAQYYSAELSQKIRRGYEDNAKKCMVAGSVPYGFRRSSSGHYEILPEEADIVREIFRRVASGESYADICRDLNDRGIKTRHGSTWNRSSFNTILHNQRYIGTYISKYHVQEDAIPQIVEKELFYKVQSTSHEKRGPRRTSNGYYSLTGKLFCGLCGDTMTGTSGTSKSGKLCFYYTCHGHRAHRCDQRSIPRDQLEDLICSAIWDDVLSDDSIRWMAHQTILDQDKLQADSDLGIVQAELVQCKNQKANILSAIKAGIFTQTTRDELLRLEQEEAELEDRIHQAEQLTAELPTEDDIISFLELFREGLEDQTLKRSAMLDAFVTRAEVHADHVLIFFRIKKEDRQACADLPEAWGECSPCAVKWTCGASKRTLYHYNGFFVLRIAA
jgi:DNA invertase Pin-like site-specific DNA recombinase